jgi:hypothetical protein
MYANSGSSTKLAARSFRAGNDFVGMQPVDDDVGSTRVVHSAEHSRTGDASSTVRLVSSQAPEPGQEMSSSGAWSTAWFA